MGKKPLDSSGPNSAFDGSSRFEPWQVVGSLLQAPDLLRRIWHEKLAIDEADILENDRAAFVNDCDIFKGDVLQNRVINIGSFPSRTEGILPDEVRVLEILELP
jgi:hypothetical protein